MSVKGFRQEIDRRPNNNLKFNVSQSQGILRISQTRHVSISTAAEFSDSELISDWILKGFSNSFSQRWLIGWLE